MLLCVLFYLKTDIFSQEYIKSLKRITFDSTVDYYPTWSPDGKYIAFGARGPKDCHVMKIPSEGGEVTQITNVHSGHPSWSPDGHYIAFDNYNERVVQIVSASGGTPIRIIPQAIPAINNRHSCWSPDGLKIAFSSEGDIYVVDLPTGRFDRIFQQEGINARPFCWTPDGLKIVIDMTDTINKKDDIWIISSDGKEFHPLTNFPGREANPHFSPDGSMIVFMSEHSGNQDIWIMSAEGGEPLQMTSHPGRDMTPRWSPEGNRIAFASDRSGNRDIWVMHIDMQVIKKTLRIKSIM